MNKKDGPQPPPPRMCPCFPMPRKNPLDEPLRIHCNQFYRTDAAFGHDATKVRASGKKLMDQTDLPGYKKRANCKLLTDEQDTMFGRAAATGKSMYETGQLPPRPFLTAGSQILQQSYQETIDAHLGLKKTKRVIVTPPSFFGGLFGGGPETKTYYPKLSKLPPIPRKAIKKYSNWLLPQRCRIPVVMYVIRINILCTCVGTRNS